MNAAPRPGISDVEALIDTGAEESCIDNLLAAGLNLPVIDRRVVCGVGSMEVDVYLAQVHVPALKFTIEGRFSGVPLEENGHHQRVLLGRTFLRYCELKYDGNSGNVTIRLAKGGPR
jgi:predicted aspartyl protease